MVVKEITTTEEKLNTLFRDNKKDSLGHLRNWQDHTHFRLKDVKVKTLLRRDWWGTGKSFHHTQSHRHSEAAVTVLQRGEATAWDSHRP